MIASTQKRRKTLTRTCQLVKWKARDEIIEVETSKSQYDFIMNN